MIQHPFPPLFDKHSKILILGSFPSVKSREEKFFYGHSQNRFWKVISAVLGCDTPASIQEKREFLLEHNIALWQVCDSYIKRICNSTNKDFLLMQAKMMLEQQLPKYFVMEWDCHADYPYNEIYPTPKMREKAIEKVKRKIEKTL